MPSRPPGRGSRSSATATARVYPVYTMAADGTDVRQVTSDPTNKWSPDWQLGRLGNCPTQLAWSPDGQKILYTAEVEPGGPVDLWVINVDGTNPVNLTVPDRAGHPNENDYQPVWCEDKTIFFTSIRNRVPDLHDLTRQPRPAQLQHDPLERRRVQPDLLPQQLPPHAGHLDTERAR